MPISSSLLANSAFSSLSLFPSPPQRVDRQQGTGFSRSRASSPLIPTRLSSKASTTGPIDIPPTTIDHIVLEQPVATGLPTHASLPFFPIPSPTRAATTVVADEMPAAPAIPQRSSSTMSPAADARPQTPVNQMSSRRVSAVILDSPSSAKTARSSIYSWSAKSLRGLRSASSIDLSSPKVLSTSTEAQSKRGSVHVDRERILNWARPLKSETKAESPSLQIFGDSMQRTRRHGKPTTSDSAANLALCPIPSPTASLSDEDPFPLTPSNHSAHSTHVSSEAPSTPPITASDIMIPSRSWSIATECTGLGMKGIEAFEAPALGLRLTDTVPSSPIIVDSVSSSPQIKRVARKPIKSIMVSAADLELMTGLPRVAPVELSSPVDAVQLPMTPVPAIPEEEDEEEGEIRYAVHARSSTAPARPSLARIGTAPRLLTQSESLNSFASPVSLAELRQLQQAAEQMELEAKRPIKAVLPVEKEKRIRRKAVPSPFVDQSQIVSSASTPSASVNAVLEQPRTFTLDVSAPLDHGLLSSSVNRSSSHSSASSSSGDRADASASESASVNSLSFGPTPILPASSSLPKMGDLPRKRLGLGGAGGSGSTKSFYGNKFASMSVMEFSPRIGSLPIFSPGKRASKTAESTPAQPIAPRTVPVAPIPAFTGYRKHSDDGYSSSSGESFGEPLTPGSVGSSTGRIGGNGFVFPPAKASGGELPSKKLGGIYGNKGAFLSQLDLGLRRAAKDKDREFEKELKAAKERAAKSAPAEVGEKKHKRGLSRFFSVKA